ncbi:hypothetical protein AXF42_Ash017820 [Apostasia shenzhenica]|uniref:Uncharacterized protein n=1 Tax=Apostasia shenzhenica TaxID=1088818 RepID=A0A2I0A3W2_9ASPA|nr:hypothetical protein AXF42_Ash017820 [Apostasia shenzhenica]
MQHVPSIVVKGIDARARLPRGSAGSIYTCETSAGSPVDPRRPGAMDVFLGVAESLREGNSGTGVLARPDQTGARRPPVREEAPKKPRIRLSNVEEGICVTPRSSESDTRTTPLAEKAIMVVDDEVLPRKEGVGDRPSAPALGIQDIPLQERSNVTPISSSSVPSAGPEISPGGGQRGPGQSSRAQYFARNVCSHLDQIEKRLASRGQATALEEKKEEVLSLLRRLEPSEAEKTIMDLESKCTRFEGDLEMAVVEIEELKRERAMLMSRIEELEEENRRRREFARAVRGLLAESDLGLSL